MAEYVPQSVRCPTLVGRAAQLATLREATTTAGKVILVSGAAGIGKSRLVADALATDGGETRMILRAACFESDQAAPYAPLIDALRGVLRPPAAPRDVWDALGPLSSDLAPLFPELVGSR